MNTRRYMVIGALVTSALAGTLIYTSQYGDRDSAALPEHGPEMVSLTQAIVIAERHVSGSARSAELEQADGRALHEVEVATAGSIRKVKVDAGDGSVLGAKPDHANANEASKDRD